MCPSSLQKYFGKYISLKGYQYSKVHISLIMNDIHNKFANFWGVKFHIPKMEYLKNLLSYRTVTKSDLNIYFKAASKMPD